MEALLFICALDQGVLAHDATDDNNADDEDEEEEEKKVYNTDEKKGISALDAVTDSFAELVDILQ